jgi:hypothetical protein
LRLWFFINAGAVGALVATTSFALFSLFFITSFCGVMVGAGRSTASFFALLFSTGATGVGQFFVA